MASAVIGALRVDLGLNTAAYDKGLASASSSSAKFAAAVKPAIIAVAAMAAAAAAAGATLIASMVKSSLETIDAQAKLAQRVGGSVAAIQGLEHAASLAGVSTETLAKAAEMLNARLGEAARTGAGPAYDALKRLGLTAAELSNLDLDDRLATIADRMRELGYTTQQQADVLRQFGIRGQEVINLLAGGGDAIRDARAEVEKYGVAVSDVDAAKVEAANDAWTKTGLVLQGIANQLAVAVAPYLEAVANKILDTSSAGVGMGSAIAGAIKTLAGGFAGLLDYLQKTQFALASISAASQIPGLIAARMNPFLSKEDLAKVEANYTAAAEEVKRLAAQPLATEALDQWFADVELGAAKAAAKIELTRKLLAAQGGSGAPAETDADRKAREAATAKLAERLDQLRASLMTEQEAEQASYQQRLSDAAEFHKDGLTSAQEYADERQRIEGDHAAKIAQIDANLAAQRQQIQTGVADSIAGILGGLSDIIGTEGKKQFEITKRLSIAIAVIKGIEATISAYAAGAKIGGPILGAVYAAAAAAATAGQIAAISRQSYNGGGSSAASGSAPSTATPAGSDSAPAATGPTLFISGIKPGSLYSGDAMRGLFDAINAHIRDGGRLVLA